MTKLIVAVLVLAALGAVAYSETQGEKEAAKPAKPDAATSPKPKASKSTSNSNDGLAASAASGAKSKAKPAVQDAEKTDWAKIDWRKRLTPLQYHITREAGTEYPFKNEYWDHFEDGEYRCVSCGLPLFESTSKFEAHCGWPSFDRTLTKDAVTKHIDRKMLRPRIEIRCRRCGAHLGHVFDDGPTETGQRYCMNSAAMKFVPAKGAVKQDPAKDKDKAATTAPPTPAPKEVPTANDGLAASADSSATPPASTETKDAPKADAQK
jgi:peptide-methionine (R)-S-oxide reductase